eukprot:07518_3
MIISSYNWSIQLGRDGIEGTPDCPSWLLMTDNRSESTSGMITPGNVDAMTSVNTCISSFFRRLMLTSRTARAIIATSSRPRSMRFRAPASMIVFFRVLMPNEGWGLSCSVIMVYVRLMRRDK